MSDSQKTSPQTFRPSTEHGFIEDQWMTMPPWKRVLGGLAISSVLFCLCTLIVVFFLPPLLLILLVVLVTMLTHSFMVLAPALFNPLLHLGSQITPLEALTFLASPPCPLLSFPRLTNAIPTLTLLFPLTTTSPLLSPIGLLTV